MSFDLVWWKCWKFHDVLVQSDVRSTYLLRVEPSPGSCCSGPSAPPPPGSAPSHPCSSCCSSGRFPATEGSSCLCGSFCRRVRWSLRGPVSKTELGTMQRRCIKATWAENIWSSICVKSFMIFYHLKSVLSCCQTDLLVSVIRHVLILNARFEQLRCRSYLSCRGVASWVDTLKLAAALF